MFCNCREEIDELKQVLNSQGIRTSDSRLIRNILGDPIDIHKLINLICKFLDVEIKHGMYLKKIEKKK